MKICQIIPHYVPAYRYGGPQRVAHGLGRAFVREGHEVKVCTTNLQDETRNLDVPLDQPVNVDGVRVYYEPTRYLRYWGLSPALYRRMKQEIPAADLILIHAHYQFAHWAGAWLARRSKVPYVIFAHGSLRRDSIASSRTILKKLYLRVLEHSNLTNALFIAFNAPEEREQSLYHDYGRIIPSGINPDEFIDIPTTGTFRAQYSELAGRYILLFLGRLDVAQKGLDLLLPAFARLRAEMPQAHLVLAGPDENNSKQQLLNLANQCGIANAVTFTGLISGQNKLGALRDADLFVLPSRFEGLSISLLEALHADLPVLVTDRVGLHREIAAAGAGVVVSAETGSIADGLHRLAFEAGARQMRGRGKALIEAKYTWDAIAKDLITQCVGLMK